MAVEPGAEVDAFIMLLQHNHTLKPIIQLLKQNSPIQSAVHSFQGGLPSKYSVLPDIPSLPSNSSYKTFRFSSSASLHQHSHGAAFVPYGVACQIDDSAAALTRWPFLPSSRRAAFEGIVVASSLFKNRTVMATMTIRQARAIRPSMLKLTITTFVSSSILDAV